MLLTHAFEVHNMVLEAVEEVVNNPVLTYMFNVHENLWEPAKKSRRERRPDLAARLDFSWNLKKNDKPKLLRYNGDVPLGQLETGILSQTWLSQKYASKLQEK